MAQFPAQVGEGFFLYATTSRPILGPTPPSIQWVPGQEPEHAPPSSAVCTSYNLTVWYLSKGTTLPLPVIPLALQQKFNSVLLVK